MALGQVGRAAPLERLVIRERQLHPKRLAELVLVHGGDVALLRRVCGLAELSQRAGGFDWAVSIERWAGGFDWAVSIERFR
eukprot:4309719-Prymnesium_polylepis.2